MGAPLSGIRVVDLSRLLPGPLASLILSDMGATVIGVDSAHNPDYMHTVPPLCDDGISLFFHALNRGKTRVSLDLRTDEGKAQFTTLLESSDILIESYRPGVLASLGFDDAHLRERWPRLIVCHLSGFGQTTKNAKVAGHDINFLAESGLLGLLDEPKAFPFPIADIAAGTFAAVIQIMAALLSRQQSGVGITIDHNITSFCGALAIAQWVGSDAGFILDGHQPAYSVYPTSDGHLAVGALEPKFWNVLVEHLGMSDLAHKGISGPDDAQRTRATLTQVFKRKTTAEWERELTSLNICVSPVRHFNDAAAASTRPNGVVLEGVTLGGREVRVPKLPFLPENT